MIAQAEMDGIRALRIKAGDFDALLERATGLVVGSEAGARHDSEVEFSVTPGVGQ